jgi:uncharacterized damage-inducible protein DinB
VDKKMLIQEWDQMRQKYGVYLRLLEAIPENRYHSNPVPGMRTAAELAVHVSRTVVRDIARGVAKGKITVDEASEDRVASGLKTKADVISFAKDCWSQANAAVAATGDAQLSAMVPTPWEMTFPGWVGFSIMRDEFHHHRGQLSVYARICNVEPPFIWGFEDNAPEFGPAK